MGEPGRGQSHLRVGETLPRLAEDGVVTDLATVQFDLAVPAGEALVEARYVPDEAEAGRVGRYEEHGRRGIRVRAGARHDDGESGSVGAGDEPLTTLEYPSARCPAGGGGQLGGVRTGPGCGLGHREAGPHVPGSERLQEPVTLYGIGDPLQQQHVALVGRGAV